MGVVCRLGCARLAHERALRIFIAGSHFRPPLCKKRCLTMSAQIQKGLAKPEGYRSLPSAVGAKLVPEVPSRTAVVWRAGNNSLSARVVAGASKIFAAGSHFLAAALDDAPPDDEHANSAGRG